MKAVRAITVHLAALLWLGLLLFAFAAKAAPAEQRASWTNDAPLSVQRASTPPVAIAEAFGFPTDKILHAAISANLALGFSALLVSAGVGRPLAFFLGAGIALAVGIAKELVDVLQASPTARGDRLRDSATDLVADGLGVGAGFVCTLLVARGQF